jgi:hypothetical protein
MICLIVTRNNEVVCKAGISNACLLSTILSGGLGDDDPASFHVSGMQELPGGRNAHVYWVHETAIVPGDHLVFALRECDDPSAPVEHQPTDSPDYIEQQREYQAFEKTYTGPVPMTPRRWPHLELRFRMRDEPEVVARLKEGEEHMMCSLDWHKWRATEGRVYVRSFTGGLPGAEGNTTDWLRGTLRIGDSLSVSVHA